MSAPTDAVAGTWYIGTWRGDGENSNAHRVSALAGMLLSWRTPTPIPPPPKLQEAIILLDLCGDGVVVL